MPVPSLLQYYRRMLAHWGPQNWWPAGSRMEMIAGAFLTQNTAWGNVERALANLRRAGKLSLEALRDVPVEELQQLLRPAGYFRQKAARLKEFLRWLDVGYGGSLDRMFARPTAELRAELLDLNGIGPETADSILLYGGGHQVFVIDAYTRRIMERHGLSAGDAKYDEIREMWERALQACPDKPFSGNATWNPRHPPSRMSRARRSPLAQHYSEAHALLVRVGNQYCRAVPRCEECPLRELLPRGPKTRPADPKIANP